MVKLRYLNLTIYIYQCVYFINYFLYFWSKLVFSSVVLADNAGFEFGAAAVVIGTFWAEPFIVGLELSSLFDKFS